MLIISLQVPNDILDIREPTYEIARAYTCMWNSLPWFVQNILSFISKLILRVISLQNCAVHVLNYVLFRYDIILTALKDIYTYQSYVCVLQALSTMGLESIRWIILISLILAFFARTSIDKINWSCKDLPPANCPSYGWANKCTCRPHRYLNVLIRFIDSTIYCYVPTYFPRWWGVR